MQSVSAVKTQKSDSSWTEDIHTLKKVKKKEEKNKEVQWFGLSNKMTMCYLSYQWERLLQDWMNLMDAW